MLIKRYRFLFFRYRINYYFQSAEIGEMWESFGIRKRRFIAVVAENNRSQRSHIAWLKHMLRKTKKLQKQLQLTK